MLCELKSLNHENLTNFLGICHNETDRFYTIYTLVERASLEDFIFDQDFNMDATFKSAFIKDIIKVSSFLSLQQTLLNLIIRCFLFLLFSMHIF